MSPTRREFLWTAGSAAAVVWWLREGLDFEWASDQVADQGWAPGIEERLSSACLLCPAHCGIRGRVVDGRLVRITGNPFTP
jgi:anaerobic selenocysteine-containing dehydrogenase